MFRVSWEYRNISSDDQTTTWEAMFNVRNNRKRRYDDEYNWNKKSSESMNEWKQQPIDNGNDDQMKEETLDLWNEEFQHQIDDDQKKKMK